MNETPEERNKLNVEYSLQNQNNTEKTVFQNRIDEGHTPNLTHTHTMQQQFDTQEMTLSRR